MIVEIIDIETCISDIPRLYVLQGGSLVGALAKRPLADMAPALQVLRKAQ